MNERDGEKGRKDKISNNSNNKSNNNKKKKKKENSDNKQKRKKELKLSKPCSSQSDEIG